MKNILFLTLLASVLLTACEATKSTPNDEVNTTVQDDVPTLEVKNTPFSARIKRGPCYGRCPVYNMTIDQARKATFNGKRFTDKLGEHERMITEAEMTELQAAFAGADWWNLEDKYDNQIVDAPTTTITLIQNGKEKAIALRGNMPDKVKAVMEMMNNLATTGDWELLSQPDYGLSEDFIANELIIKLKAGNTIEDFLIPFQKQNMQLKRAISKPANIYLVTYEPSMVTPQEMIEFVKAREEVIDAEFNKKVTPRED